MAGHAKFIVGLTGGIGSGKSAVSERFAALGIEVVDADLAARVVVELGQPALAAIRDRFGDEILTSEGSLDRPALRKIVFSRASERLWLESLLHPLIGGQLEKELAHVGSSYGVLVSPLLKETGQVRLVDRVLVVHADDDRRVERTLARDGGEESGVRAILDAQMPSKERLAMADDVIVNESDLAHLDAEVARLDACYKKLAEAVN